MCVCVLVGGRFVYTSIFFFLQDFSGFLENNPEKLHNLSVMRANYDKLTSDKVAKSLMLTKQTYYDQGEKAGKLLAWRIKKMKSERTINSIKLKSGKLTMDPIEIVILDTSLNSYTNQNIKQIIKLFRNHLLTSCNFRLYQRMRKQY